MKQIVCPDARESKLFTIVLKTTLKSLCLGNTYSTICLVCFKNNSKVTMLGKYLFDNMSYLF